MSLSDAILLLTAALIAWYCIETQKLRSATEDNTKFTEGLLTETTEGTRVAREDLAEVRDARLLSVRPVVVIDPQGSRAAQRTGGDFVLENVGAGPELNVEMRISQIRPEDFGYTNLRNVLLQGSWDFFAMAGGDNKAAYIDYAVLAAYAEQTDGDFSYGLPEVFVLILSYVDVFENPYVTVVESLFSGGFGLATRRTQVASYATGELPRFGPPFAMLSRDPQ